MVLIWLRRSLVSRLMLIFRFPGLRVLQVRRLPAEINGKIACRTLFTRQIAWTYAKVS
jgi:hypothetical protein